MAISASVVNDDNCAHKLIYYMSKPLYDVEKRYSLIKKMTFAFIVATRKFSLYFQAHSVIMPT